MTDDSLPPEWTRIIEEDKIKTEMDFREASKQYQLGKCPGSSRYWINGETLRGHFQENFPDFKNLNSDFKCWIPLQLPIFMVANDGSVRQINDYLNNAASDHTIPKMGKASDPTLDSVFGAANRALTWPNFWWFKKLDVIIFEKLHSVPKPMFPLLSLLWLTEDELEARWKNKKISQMVKDGLTAYTLSLTGVTSRSETTDENDERDESPLGPRYNICPEFVPHVRKYSPYIFRLRDVRKFERENYDLLEMKTKDVWSLRVADSVKSWIRFRPDLLNDCLKERLYSRCSAQIREPLWGYYSGGPKSKSANLMKALAAADALRERDRHSGGSPGSKFRCPWRSCKNINCAHIETSLKRSLMSQS
ncbi:hypothetical protein [Desulfomonile tiedjei]|uniref:Uncharacterized protein n=1 Tax=Desulfomonile tiedjei (strain ATCC 49306 / DSM 6799 / DCB-1) TaxID=706587 RepID=I4C2B9_DESTA|nr:hypothetical protein [Desulfomonile tiedjei]AFM23710.1 hypothetical protein Desti_0992 [Desulfomonile tiedjei DSM 6799]